MKNVSTASNHLATTPTTPVTPTTNPLVGEMRKSLTDYCEDSGLTPAEEAYELLAILNEASDFATATEKPTFLWLLNLPVLMMHDSLLQLWAQLNADYLGIDTTTLVAKLVILELATDSTDYLTTP